MRYTEVRMTKVAEAMLEDIEKDTVEYTPNYDESLKEPDVYKRQDQLYFVCFSTISTRLMMTMIKYKNKI